MADLKLNLKAETIAKLMARAKRNGHSLNKEIKSILMKAAGTNDVGAQLREWNKRWKRRKFDDSTDLIREDRDR